MGKLNQLLLLSAVLSLSACQPQLSIDEKELAATASTRNVHKQSYQQLNFADRQDFEFAEKGLIARPTGQIMSDDGKTVLVDFSEFDFIQGESPDTVNPSLWRHAQLNNNIGLFMVMEGIYQLRGFDLANMTLIAGQQGWIVVDPLTSRETASAALDFAWQHLPERPITAVIFTHSHVDHFGGVLGAISKEDAARRMVPIIAPEGFMEEATSENVLVGPAMARRSMYQFGKNLVANNTGLIDTGLGKRVGYGKISILPPTVVINKPKQSMRVDGVEFVFSNTPGAEAPSELTFYLPQHKAYGGAELLAKTMHNFLPIRGAKVRDVLRWSGYMQAALDDLGEADVYFGQHNWPIWGNQNIRQFITMHRDVYKYLHDQTIRLANTGLTAAEIAEQLQLPTNLASYFGTRGYYGDIRHNVKAIYQRYLGAYDGNPANLNRLPPSQAAQGYLELVGGSANMILAAQQAYDTGNYRWAAELLNHVMFAEPDHAQATGLLIKTYRQLGYQAESATWRNSYLTAADELQFGIPEVGVDRASLLGLMKQTPTERFLEAMASSINGLAAEGTEISINLTLPDTNEQFVVWLENSVLHHRPSAQLNNADVNLTISKDLLVGLLSGAVDVFDLLDRDDIALTGSKLDFIAFVRLLEPAPQTFEIVTGR
jgi:alkyl sulfatase BDS1-like metallo-beta-lactamase superfamily hydrolase